MIQITVDWTGLPGGDAVSVLHFDAIGQDATDAAVGALEAVLIEVCTLVHTGVTAQINPDVRLVQESSGHTLEYYTADAGPATGGTASDYLPQGAMVLVQMRTGTVIRGRRVQGRTFLPGFTIVSANAGAVGGGTMDIVTDAFSDLIAAGLVVYSRPLEGGAGTVCPVISVSTWGDFAFLGKRRS